MHKGNHLSCGQAVLQIGDKLIVGGGLGRVSSLVYLLVSSVENSFFLNFLFKISSEWWWRYAGNTLGA